MSFPRYPKYKASGVEWLGDVPVGWEVVQYKQFVEIQNGSDHKHVEQSEGYPVFGSGGIFAYASEFLYDGESVLLGRKGTIDRPLYVTGRFWTVDTMYWTKIRSNTSGRYIYYLAVTIPFDYYSTNTALPSMTKGALNSHLVTLPPLPEQTAIAEFLDRETAKIDELVAEQRRLTELLKEKRQAVISHVVTKGLNPHAPMKPSGIEWLGEVPEHWRQTPIKHTLNGIIDTEHKTAPFFEDGEYLVVRTKNIKNGKLLLDGAKYTDIEGYIEWTKRGVPEPGDILFTREAPAGEACLVPNGMKLCVGQRTLTMRVNQKAINSRFVLWSLYGGISAKFIADLSQGSTVAHFNMSDIGNIPILLPPIEEQSDIATFLDSELAKFDALTAEAQRAIDLLQERRTALISAAVTGQIDVRQQARN